MPQSLNNNAYAETKRMLLGVGSLYIDDTYVGNLKGTVTFKYKREYAYQRAGNNLADQKGEVIGEEATLEAEVCDLKLAQLRRAFGVAQAVDTTTAKNIRKREVIQLSLAGQALAETPLSGTVKVTTLDRKSAGISGTDYKVSGSNFELVSGGAFVAGQWVAVEYSFSDAGAQSLQVGGEIQVPPTFRLDYVITDETGKAWQLRFFKAMANTDFEIGFHDRESGDFTVHNVSFKALVDATKPEGQNLLEWVQEDANT